MQTKETFLSNGALVIYHITSSIIFLLLRNARFDLLRLFRVRQLKTQIAVYEEGLSPTTA